MYRAVTWLRLSQQGVSADDAARGHRIAAAYAISPAALRDGESTILLDGVDPDAASLPRSGERERLRHRQHSRSAPPARRPSSAPTRTSTTSSWKAATSAPPVFPETPYKFYIDASPEVRARRRARQGLQDAIAARDKIDSTRRSFAAHHRRGRARHRQLASHRSKAWSAKSSAA